MRIIDCIIFYNETKMLFYRLESLYDVVDYFVIVESSHTFSGNEKPSFFKDNINLYLKFLNKIIHVIVDDCPNNGNAWDNEYHQRNSIKKGLDKLQLYDDDLIFICDCDEIPDKNTLSIIKQTPIPFANIVDSKLYSLEMDMYYYNLNCKGTKWYGSKFLTYNHFKNAYNSSAQKVRDVKNYIVILNGGWHLSYFGDVEFIKNKIMNFSHQEYNNNHYLDSNKIQKQIDNYVDLFFRDTIFHGLKKVELVDNAYLPHNHELLIYLMQQK